MGEEHTRISACTMAAAPTPTPGWLSATPSISTQSDPSSASLFSLSLSIPPLGIPWYAGYYGMRPHSTTEREISLST